MHENLRYLRYLYAIIVMLLCISCKTPGTRSGTELVERDTLRPETVAEADYAIRNELYQLRQQIGRARTVAEELRMESIAIRDVSRRSAQSIQEIIERAEALDRWVNWAVDRITYLEKLLAADIREIPGNLWLD